MAVLEGDTQTVRYANPAFCRLWDVPVSQLVGKPCAEIMPRMDVFLTRLKRVYGTGKAESHNEAQYVKPHPVFWTYAMWPMLAGGTTVGVMVQVTESAPIHAEMVAVNEALVLGALRQHELNDTADKLNAQLRNEIIERYQAEVALRENEWRLRYAADSARLTYVEADLVSGGARTADNFATVMGYTPPLGQETDIAEGTKQLLAHVVAEDRARVAAAHEEFVGAKPSGKLKYRVLGDDQIERWIETRWIIEHDVDGKPLKSFATNIDITERKNAEAALHEGEERYRNLFNSIDEGFCIFDVIFDAQEKAVDLLYVEANPAFAKQSGMKDVVGKRIRELAPVVEDYWFDIYGKVAITGEPIRAENEFKATKSWFDVYAFQIGEPKQRRIAVIFNNITARKRSEAALIELDHRKDEFLAMLSHELRNPLAPILHAVHLLRLQKDEDSIQHQARGIIERQVGQMTRLIGDLMEVSRLTTGRINLHRERLELSHVIKNAVETVNPLIDRQRHVITLNLPLEPIWLHADAARIEQIIVNLLTNAAKYTIESGSIWLTLAQEGEEAVVCIRDSGIGIAPELLPHIFDLFTQAERSLDRSEGGLGIGLCLVQRLLEMHGGSVA
ncbi:MAG: PAS domain-containing protein, partial [Aeromicrobium sp.]|nr:PAS domain-containing protein [Burkholderiales bacterium]